MVDTPRTVMWSISDIAERDGVSKQAVSKKVGDLVEKHGLTVERDSRGRVASVNVAEYDHKRGLFDDPSKTQRPAQPEMKVKPSETYEEALRQKTWHEAERRRLELESLKGSLVPLAEIEIALGEVAADIIQALDRLPALADDIAAAIARDGGHGARVVLKGEVERLRSAIADALDKAIKPASGEAA